jgi:hypothetical protein
MKCDKILLLYVIVQRNCIYFIHDHTALDRNALIARPYGFVHGCLTSRGAGGCPTGRLSSTTVFRRVLLQVSRSVQLFYERIVRQGCADSIHMNGFGNGRHAHNACVTESQTVYCRLAQVCRNAGTIALTDSAQIWFYF